MNEYYARDTSRKIRSTFQSKGKSGKHLTGTVIYGYLWNEARDQWLVDPEAADVVKRIFAMTIDGYGPYQIASKLKSEKVLIPSAYLAQHGEGVNKNKTFKDVYGWGSSTICNLLEKREYLGHTINFKTRKHFKDKKSHYVPEDEWTIFENTHEPIIDQQTFDLVQKIRGNVRRYPDGWGEAAPLTGLLYCADCGGKKMCIRDSNQSENCRNPQSAGCGIRPDLQQDSGNVYAGANQRRGPQKEHIRCCAQFPDHPESVSYTHLFRKKYDYQASCICRSGA